MIPEPKEDHERDGLMVLMKMRKRWESGGEEVMPRIASNGDELWNRPKPVVSYNIRYQANIFSKVYIVQTGCDTPLNAI